MKKILFIDEAEPDLGSLSSLIAGIFDDVVVYSARSGQEGIESASFHRPDLVYLDMHLTSMDGFELCRRLKNDQALRDIPVVFIISDKENQEKKLRALQVGAEGFLTKPIVESDLIAQLATMLKIKAASVAGRKDGQGFETQAAQGTKRVEIVPGVKREIGAQLLESEERFRVAQELSPDGFTILHPIRDDDGDVIDFYWVYENEAIAAINGTDSRAVIGKRLLELFPSHRGSEVFDAYVLVAATGESRILEEVYVGEILSVPTWLRLVIVSMGDDIAVLGQNITARKKAEKLLAESEERYRALFENSGVVQMIISPDDGSIVNINKAAERYYGWAREELIGKSMAEINTLPLTQLQEKMRLAARSRVNRFQFKHRRANGIISDVEVHSGPVPIGGVTYLHSIIHDISLQVEAQRERDEIAARLTHYLATSPTITYAFRLLEGEISMQWISENVAEILGYPTKEALGKDWWFNNLVADDRARALQGMAELMRLGAYVHEYRFIKKDRTTVWLRDEMRLAHAEDVEAAEAVGTLTDITSRKKSEGEMELKSAALEAAGNAIVITDREGTIEWVNQSFVALTGYSKSEAVGKNPRALVKSDAQDPGMYASLWDTINSGRNWQGELVNRKKNGELYDEEMLITPVLDESGRTAHFIAIKNDITEKKRSRKLLENSVHEKVALLREVHHRVKNNMQVITSLLNLSETGRFNGTASVAKDALRRRINAMAMVHDQFYRTADLSRIDFSAFIMQQVDFVLEEFGASPGDPDVRFALSPLPMDLDAAIPAGLIVSELLSNAVKFSRERHDGGGLIVVSLTVRGEKTVELEIRDNGPGFPDGFDLEEAGTLGMQLVHILTQQLGGTIRLRNDAGAAVILRFDAP